MRILIHDHSGHPFQAELSRELAARGHTVTHSFASGYVCGKGKLTAEPGENLTFEGIGGDRRIEIQRLRERVVRETLRGFSLTRQALRTKADVTMVSNAQIPTLVVFAFCMMLLRRPWVLWHQDVYAVAVRSMAGCKLPRWFLLVAAVFAVGEKWASRRAESIVVIAPSFVDIHEGWGTAHKVHVIPNWAPLEEIAPVERHNAWSAEQDLDGVATLLYSGTLGLKHDPALLVELAEEMQSNGTPVRLVVVNEGPAVDLLRDEAARLDVPITLLPFQPYDRLPEVLGSGDVLVVLLDKSAGAFSVPSKTLSYLCAGRPILGLMPEENLAACLISKAGGRVLAPDRASLPEAAAWASQVIADGDLADELGRASRDLAEQEFALAGCADRFERLLAAAVGAEVPAVESAPVEDAPHRAEVVRLASRRRSPIAPRRVSTRRVSASRAG